MAETDEGIERRSGGDRRSGEDRRKESRGIRNAFLFRLFLDRRSGRERRGRGEGRFRTPATPLERRSRSWRRFWEDPDDVDETSGN